MVDSLQAETATRGAVSRDRKRAGAPGGRIPSAIAFLEVALARCAVAVVDLEVSARADRLLGERQSITVSKKFRAAKKKLGSSSAGMALVVVASGFGPCGWAGREWPRHRRPCSRW